mmetsp:Transcript_17909/g.30100  ORF Transcript_17909/g.30100 Transcript_17909/m.30100 type:complete len:229 (+) Transcript_17909:478-1164(+)
MNYLRRQTVLPHITRSVRRLSNNTAKVLRNNSLPLAQAAPVGSGVGPPLLSANCKGGERFQSALLQSLRFHTHTCRQLHVTAHNGAEQEDTPTTIGQVNSSGRKNLYIMFTCTVCDTRSMKGMSRKSYDTGVVLVTCPGCEKIHLIADHLGWFQDGSFTVETLMAERGEAVVRGADGTIELNPEDIAGRSRLAEFKTKLSADAQQTKSSSEESVSASDEAARLEITSS